MDPIVKLILDAFVVYIKAHPEELEKLIGLTIQAIIKAMEDSKEKK